jgi:porin
MYDIPQGLRRIALACAVLLAWASLAEAKRFKRYPDDLEEQKQSAPSQVSQRGDEPVAEDAGGGGEWEAYEPEEAPGLLGFVPHGQGGLTIEYIYTGEVFTNMRGGVNTHNATEYLGLFDLALTGDLDHYGFAPGGTVFLLAESLHGRGITADHVGDYQTVSNMDADRQDFQVSEFWWERGILGGDIRVRIGKQDANAEFGVVDLGGDFINASFGMQPNIPMPAWPDQAMGVVTFFQLTDSLSFNVGVFDGAADGRTWGVSGTGEIFSIFELKAQWALCNGRLPGDMHVGVWHHNGDPEDPGDPNVTYADNHGAHFGFDQMIYRESRYEDDDQGLGVFIHYGWAPEERNEVPDYVGGGLVYKGLVPGRDDDMTGVGVANVFFSERMGLPSDHETAIEVFHKLQLSPYIVIQPDLQIITRPSGAERDAVVAGLRFEVVL